MPAENAHEHRSGSKCTALILWGIEEGNGEVTREVRPCIRRLRGGISKGHCGGTILDLLFASIACRRHLVACAAKILVPRLRKAGDDLLGGLACYFHPRMDDISPSVNTRPAFRGFFERDPLRQHDSERMVNPAHFSRGLAVGDHMAHYGLYRLHDFDLQPAARFPRPALSPVELSVDVGKLIPTPPVGENLPDALAPGLGGHTILKSKHDFSSLLFERSSFLI